MNTKETIEIKAYSKQELAALYKISVRSMSAWLKPFEKGIGKRYGWYYNPNQVRYIFDRLGLPGE